MFGTLNLDQCNTQVMTWTMQKLLDNFERGIVRSAYRDIGYATKPSMSSVAMYPILGLPLWPIVCYEESGPTVQVFDGKKRMAIWRMFRANEFTLEGLTGCLADFNHCDFDHLPAEIVLRWTSAKIPYFVLSNTFKGDREVLKDIYTKSI